MRWSVHDDFGGRLSLKSDEELIRIQRACCMGCGEPLNGGFLGFDKNYQPCRYHGGLFCRKWCHGDEYRQIPHRLLLYWDHVPHRVSRQAAAFLDTLWRRPILLVDSVNPLLYEGIPALRLARNMRCRAQQYITHIVEAEGDGGEVRDIVLSRLGADRVHLCLADDLYTIADLLSIHSGELHATMEKLISALRNQDRTVGADSTKRGRGGSGSQSRSGGHRPSRKGRSTQAPGDRVNGGRMSAGMPPSTTNPATI